MAFDVECTDLDISPSCINRAIIANANVFPLSYEWNTSLAVETVIYSGCPNFNPRASLLYPCIVEFLPSVHMKSRCYFSPLAVGEVIRNV